jgi:flagellar protein FliO/FliZ
MTVIGFQSLMAVLLVLGLVGALAWVARRGTFASLQKRGGVAIETAVPLGERRSLVVVAVEGRRLLLGMTPTHISMVTELRAEAPAAADRSRTLEPGSPAGGRSFEQEVTSRS